MRGSQVSRCSSRAVADDGLGDDAGAERVARGARVGHLVPQDVLVDRALAQAAEVSGQLSASQFFSAMAENMARTSGHLWPWP